MSKHNNGKLFIIPIVVSSGTQHEVIPPVVRDTIAGLNYFMVENARTARRFISSLDEGIAIDSLHFEVLDKRTTSTEVEKYMQPLLSGENAGVLSESGSPGIADPGAMAVKYAHRHNIRVIPLPGPSSITLGLMASGFNGQSFTFHGYLPINKHERKKKIIELEKESAKQSHSQVFIEAPYRNTQLFRDLLSYCKEDTYICLASDLTGSSEFVKTLRVKQWKSISVDLHKIPTVFLIFSD